MTEPNDSALAEECRDHAGYAGQLTGVFAEERAIFARAADLLDAQAKELDERRKYIAQLEQQLLDRIDPLRDLPR